MNNTTAIVFPGQGSQQLGMLADYYHQFSIVRDTFDEAQAALGYDLWDVIQNNETKLNQTEYTQPAILAASYAIWRVMKQVMPDLQPQYLAGHSLGEYTALTVAGSLKFVDALQLVRERGRIMQTGVAGKECAMSAILGLDDQAVINACKDAASVGIVEPANFNSPGQVVISGEKVAVEQANANAKERGAKRAQMLAVSVPSHCSLMKDAAGKFAEFLEKVHIATPKIPIIHNVDVAVHETPSDIRKALIKQLYGAVLWTQTIEHLTQNNNIDTVIECGPNKVLSGLNKRICKTAIYFDTSSVEALQMIIKA